MPFLEPYREWQRQSLIPRVFSLPEMWAPHLFSYMACSRLSSSENSAVLIESTELAIFATFLGLSEISHSFNCSWTTKRQIGTSPQLCSVQRILYSPPFTCIRKDFLSFFLLWRRQDAPCWRSCGYYPGIYTETYKTRSHTPAALLPPAHSCLWRIPVVFCLKLFSKECNSEHASHEIHKIIKEDIKVKSLALSFVYLRAWLVDFFFSWKTALGHSPFLQCYCLVG